MSPAQILGLVRPWRRPLAVLAGLMFLDAAARLAVPWLAARLAGGLVGGGAAEIDAGRLVAMLIALLAGIALLRAVTNVVTSRTAERILAALRLRIHDHLLRLPLPFHLVHRQGDLLAISTWEIGKLSKFLSVTLVALGPQLLAAAGAVVLMLRIDPVLGLAVPVLVPAFYLGLRVVGRRLRRLSEDWQQAEAEVLALAEQDLSLVAAIKSFTREDVAHDRYAAAVGRSRALAIRESMITGVVDPVVGFVAGAAVVLLLLGAGRSFQAGAMTGPELFAFLFYAAFLTRPVAALAGVYGEVQGLRGTLTRLGRVLEEAPETDPPRAAALPRRARGEIAFEGVRFAWPDRPPVFENLSLHVPAGQTLALTGPNGAGKSTLLALLSRVILPDAGRILLDGADIAGLRLADLRRQVGLVPQSPALFEGSVADNIRFGREPADAAAIAAAARLAQADAFVSALPRGYATPVGDHGTRLSGGQGQRIALARALLKDPPVLLLDEATSMLDTAGEEGFVAEAREALSGRTVLVVTHRPATLALADRIVRLEDGRLVEVAG